ncbi:hypothetical protein V8C34DRAFT_272863 [Trichoderma compactum]
MKTIYFGVSYDFFADLASEQALIFLVIDFDLILISLCYFFSLCYIWMAFNISFSTPLWFFSFTFSFCWILSTAGGSKGIRHKQKQQHNRHATGPSPEHACTFERHSFSDIGNMRAGLYLAPGE